MASTFNEKQVNKVKVVDSHIDYLFWITLNMYFFFPFFEAISEDMDSKRIKVDKSQQIEKLNKITPI